MPTAIRVSPLISLMTGVPPKQFVREGMGIIFVDSLPGNYPSSFRVAKKWQFVVAFRRRTSYIIYRNMTKARQLTGDWGLLREPSPFLTPLKFCSQSTIVNYPVGPLCQTLIESILVAQDRYFLVLSLNVSHQFLKITVTAAKDKFIIIGQSIYGDDRDLNIEVALLLVVP